MLRSYWGRANCLELKRDQTRNELPPGRSQRRQSKRGLHFFSLRPIVIGVAFETARLRMFRSRRMTRLAGCNPRQKHVARLSATQGLLVTTRARKSPVRVMIESRMRHPLYCCSRWFDDRPIILSRSHRERMALLASLSPQEFLGIFNPCANPLIRRVHSHSRLCGLPRQIVPRVAHLAQLPRMRRNILAEFFHKKRVHNLRLIVRHAFIEPLVKRQRMASRARVREFHRRHQLAATLVPRTRQRPALRRKNFVLFRVTNVG